MKKSMGMDRFPMSFDVGQRVHPGGPAEGGEFRRMSSKSAENGGNGSLNDPESLPLL